MVECPKCGGVMIEGELYMSVPVPQGSSMMGGMMPIPGMNMGNIGVTEETGLRWREKTGEKKGFLFKSDETRTMAIKGHRCPGCRYIELYAEEDG